jgi:hypothetical protein
MIQDRQTDRASVRWTVRYERRLDGRWSAPNEALCLNIGGYGMLLVVSEALGDGEVVRLHMWDATRALPFTEARVQWSRCDPDSENFIAGIEFVDELKIAANN